MKTLKFIQHHKQGGKWIAPNCKDSELLQQFLGKNSRGDYRNFTQRHLDILSKLGYSITIENKLPLHRRAKKQNKDATANN